MEEENRGSEHLCPPGLVLSGGNLPRKSLSQAPDGHGRATTVVRFRVPYNRSVLSLVVIVMFRLEASGYGAAYTFMYKYSDIGTNHNPAVRIILLSGFPLSSVVRTSSASNPFDASYPAGRVSIPRGILQLALSTSILPRRECLAWHVTRAISDSTRIRSVQGYRAVAARTRNERTNWKTSVNGSKAAVRSCELRAG